MLGASFGKTSRHRLAVDGQLAPSGGVNHQNGGFILWTRTTMSDPCLPPELVDNIVDLLYDKPETLKRCCLVSKSWVPRARNYLFADIRFPAPKRLQSWKEIFPDPANSPARYAKTLYIGPYIVTAASPEVDGWIRDFSGVEHLEVYSQELFPHMLSPFSPFHGLSPVVKSLRMSFAVLLPPWTFNLILSFPLIEDLAVIVRGRWGDDGDGDGDGFGEGGIPTAAQPSGSPMFTGTLELYLKGGMDPFARRLLSLPGGIHFRNLTLTWSHDGDIWTTMTLVNRCSHSLESLRITGEPPGTCIWYLRPHR
jgi:hypothetical protein